MEQSGRFGLPHDVTQGCTARLTPYGIERSRHLGRLGRLPDRQSEYGDDRRIAYFANELGSERSEQVREALAVARHGQVSRHLKSLGALGDAGHEHFLLVADQRIELAFRNPRASGDLQGTGCCVAAFRECPEGRLQDAAAHRGFIAVVGAASRHRSRRHDSPT